MRKGLVLVRDQLGKFVRLTTSDPRLRISFVAPIKGQNARTSREKVGGTRYCADQT